MFALTGLVLVGAENADHWAYKPVVRPEIPPQNGGVKGNGVDYFLERAFQKEKITPNPEADRHTLIRRLTVNLTGLPPTISEIDAFVADKSPDAYDKLVKRLLGSPHYGERWGRHWLDVARYVQGTVKVPGVDRIDLAEEYRDYVVRSFNSDKPYDQFIAEQLAGDLLEGDDSDYLDRAVAPSFLSIGPWFDECTDPNKLKLDIVDEQISTVTKAFLGLDFACSRCHDHKFDPIPTRDYYALAGIFRSTKIISDFSDFWKDGRPRLTQPFALPGEIESMRKKERQVEVLEAKRWAILSQKRRGFISDQEAAFQKRSREIKPARQIRGWEAENFSGHKNLVTVDGKYTPAIQTRVPMEQWAQYDFHLKEGGDFLLYIRYATPVAAPVKLELNRQAREERLPLSSTGGMEYQHYRWEAFGPYTFVEGANRIRLLVDRHEPFPKLDSFKLVANPGTAPRQVLDRALWRYSHSKNFWPPMIAEMELILPESELIEVRQLDSQIEKLRSGLDLPETLSVTERETMIEEPVRDGGQVYRKSGEPVPRGLPTMFPDIAGKYSIDSGRSGRLEFAQWLTDPGNSLTPRVLVNRIWQWHFGKGLVGSPDNFGIQGAPPENGALLDWLASELVSSGWSIKHIQRLIVHSNAYRRSSRSHPKDHVLLASFPKRRLEAEAIYDGMLGTTNKVPRQPSGSPLEVSRSKDRALYILVSSRSPLGLGIEIRKMFTLFGYDPSGRPIHRRPDTVTPDQSLWFLNNPLPRYYANRLSEKLLTGKNSATDCVEDAFLTVVSHPPSRSEAESAHSYLSFLLGNELSQQEALSRMILGLFSSERFTHLY